MAVFRHPNGIQRKRGNRVYKYTGLRARVFVQNPSICRHNSVAVCRNGPTGKHFSFRHSQAKRRYSLQLCPGIQQLHGSGIIDESCGLILYAVIFYIKEVDRHIGKGLLCVRIIVKYRFDLDLSSVLIPTGPDTISIPGDFFVSDLAGMILAHGHLFKFRAVNKRVATNRGYRRGNSKVYDCRSSECICPNLSHIAQVNGSQRFAVHKGIGPNAAAAKGNRS